MLTCEQTEHLFDAYLDDELSSSLRAEVHAHRLECSHCNHRLSLLACCGEVVGDNVSEPSLREDFTDRLMGNMPPRKVRASGGTSPRFYRLFAAVATAAAAVAITVLIVPPFHRKAPVPESVVASDVVKTVFQDGKIRMVTEESSGQARTVRYADVPASLAELMVQGGIGRTMNGWERLRVNNEQLRQLGKMVLLGTIDGLRTNVGEAKEVIPAAATPEEPAMPSKPMIDQFKIERNAEEYLPT
jgi:hypothetical protein